MSREPRDARVDRYLRGLPTDMPPAGLGQRIIDQHLSRRRLRRWAPLAAAASILLALLVWRAQGPAEPPPISASRPPAALIDLRSLDRQLQDAYLAGADGDELARLWQARDRAMAELQAPSEPSLRRQVRL